jgi:hypothetical protein
VGSISRTKAASVALGRGLVFVTALGLAGVVLLAREARAAAGAEQALHLPVRSSGDLLFYFDFASFSARPGPARSEIYLRLPGNELGLRRFGSGRGCGHGDRARQTAWQERARPHRARDRP